MEKGAYVINLFTIECVLCYGKCIFQQSRFLKNQNFLFHSNYGGACRRLYIKFWFFKYTSVRAYQIACLTCPCANVLSVLTCPRANMPCVLTCSRANVPCVLTCLRALRAYVPTCLACLRAHLPICLAYLRAHVSMCLAWLRAQVPTCPRAHVL